MNVCVTTIPMYMVLKGYQVREWSNRQQQDKNLMVVSYSVEILVGQQVGGPKQSGENIGQDRKHVANSPAQYMLYV